MDNGSCMELSTLTLTDLPALTDLIIGSDENCNNSYSFYCCKKLELCNLPSLQTLEFGLFSFFLTSSLQLASTRSPPPSPQTSPASFLSPSATRPSPSSKPSPGRVSPT